MRRWELEVILGRAWKGIWEGSGRLAEEVLSSQAVDMWGRSGGGQWGSGWAKEELERDKGGLAASRGEVGGLETSFVCILRGGSD